MEGLRPTIEWINRKGLHNLHSCIYSNIHDILFSGSVQQEIGLRLSQGNHYYALMHYAVLILIISAVDGRDRDLQGRETVPESWGLEGERETWLPCLRPLQVCLRATVFLILQRLVYFSTYILCIGFD